MPDPPSDPVPPHPFVSDPLFAEAFAGAAPLVLGSAIGMLVGNLLDTGHTPVAIGHIFKRYAKHHQHIMASQTGQNLKDATDDLMDGLANDLDS